MKGDTNKQDRRIRRRVRIEYISLDSSADGDGLDYFLGAFSVC